MAPSANPSTIWTKAALVVAVGAAGFLASNLGWIDVSTWPLVGKFVPARPAAVAPADSETEEEVELPPEVADAQYEPELTEEESAEDAAGLWNESSEDETVTRASYEEETAETAPPQDEQAEEVTEQEDLVEETPAPRTSIRPSRRVALPPEEPAEDEPAEAAPAVDRRRSGASRTATPRARQVANSVPADESGDLAAIDDLIAANDYVEAQRELSRLFFSRPRERGAIQSRLNKLSQTLYFAPQPQFHEPYVVQAGDQLRSIGKKYKLSWEYLAKLNRVAPSKIREGQKLKVMQGPFGVRVSLSRFELVLHLDGSYVKHYRVGVGKDGASPVGTFLVKNKQVDPTYYGPEGVIRHDDPENPLGEHWIDIGDSFGIHGTNEPDSIGKAESKGCIRMKNEDVAELYDFLVVGSEVKIER
ncbi:MAG: L,D-transpeptidase family protein [Planctomycetaceae bacterium]|jgi:LysM repeat protein